MARKWILHSSGQPRFYGYGLSHHRRSGGCSRSTGTTWPTGSPSVQSAQSPRRNTASPRPAPGRSRRGRSAWTRPWGRCRACPARCWAWRCRGSGGRCLCILQHTPSRPNLRMRSRLCSGNSENWSNHPTPPACRCRTSHPAPHQLRDAAGRRTPRPGDPQRLLCRRGLPRTARPRAARQGQRELGPVTATSAAGPARAWRWVGGALALRQCPN
mmetsp:Transcript_73188/g.210186  ORF Transcript_73188/g.210186 Transcript_73188/m.210186 type:complete len:214 (+) Transcript_73188:1608-2249(+)